jgi:hypothetical protein
MHHRACFSLFVGAVIMVACAETPEPAEDGAASPAVGGGGGVAADAAVATGAGPSNATGSGAGAPAAEPQPTRTVLLIPGTTIPGSYFDEMAARLSRDGFLPVVFEPPDLFTESLVTGAARISDQIDTVLAESGESRVHIVAECNGGVATRYALQVLGGWDRVDQVVTFVSAHHGTWLSPVGDWTTGFQSLADITPGSPFLTELDAAPFPAGLSFTSIYSCNDELMLPYDTSVVDGATNVLFCDYYVGHFDGFWDPVVYDRIHAALIGNGDQAPNAY